MIVFDPLPIKKMEQKMKIVETRRELRQLEHMARTGQFIIHPPRKPGNTTTPKNPFEWGWLAAILVNAVALTILLLRND